jgi:hypothetical protein
MVKAQVGDLIKSLDFAGNTDHYMIGKVTQLEGDFIYCDTIKIVRGGKSTDIANGATPWFKTAQEGTMFMDESFPGRVAVIG